MVDRAVDPHIQECHPQILPTVPIHFEEWFPNNTNIAIRSVDSRYPLTYDGLRMQCAAATRFVDAASLDRVAVLFHRDESAELAVCLITLMNAGCTACPIDPSMTQYEITKALQCLQCSTVVTTPLASTLHSLACALIVVKTSRTDCGVLQWPTFSSSNADVELQLYSEKPLLVLQTSGTTAQAKIVELTMPQLQRNAAALATSMDLRSTDVCLNVMPFFHIGGIACSLLAVLWAQSSVISMPWFEPESFLEVLEGKWRPTWYYAAPTIHKALLLHFHAVNPTSRARTQLRFIRAGAAHLPHEDAADLARVFRCAVLPTYSMTECMPICAPAPDYRLEKPDSVGFPIGPSVRIGDAQGRPLAYGTVGEVLIRGPGVFNGYAGGQNAGAFTEDNWFRTGDRGRLDWDGWLFLAGRVREMAKRGGEQISLHEVDEAVQQHPNISICVSFAVPNEFWGEEVAAAVVLTDGASATVTPCAIQEFLRTAGRIGNAKIPARIVILPSENILPKTHTGKFIRTHLHSVLNCSPVDFRAQAAIGSDLVSVPRAPPVSKAIYGVRFLFAYWVAQMHIGAMPWKQWARIQGTSFNMVGFTFIAGFTLASSVTSPLRSWFEARQLVVNRLSVIHTLYLLALVYALPCFFIVWRDLIGTMSWWQHGINAVLHLFGFGVATDLFFPAPAVLSVTWFQAMLYVNVALFPLTDAVARRVSATTLKLLLALSILLSSLIMPTGMYVYNEPKYYLQWNYFPMCWFPCFTSGVLSCHLWRRSYAHHNSARWATLTDACSLCLLLLMVLVATVRCFFPFADGFFVREGCAEEPSYADFLAGKIHYGLYQYGRWPSQLGQFLGFERMCSLLLVVWICGLAYGNGWTARLLSSRIFVHVLAPLAYPLYLLHLPTAMYVYWIFHNDGGDWWKEAGRKIVPIPWYLFFFTVAISLVVGWLAQNCVGPLVPHIMGVAQRVFFVRAVPRYESVSTLAKIQEVIRTLTGTDCDHDTMLDSVGVDSFGAVALIGVLRATFPHARHLKANQFRMLRTIGQLVEHLDVLEGGESGYRACDS